MKLAEPLTYPLNRIDIATSHPQPEQVSHVTLIHGWAAESLIWQDWATTYLVPFHSITLIDLPGFGDSPAIEETDNLQADWLKALAETLPAKTHLLGWSLGGLLAQQLAKQCPQQVESLVCLASTPRFTQYDHWQYAVNPEIIGNFIHAISNEVGMVLKKFWRLQLQGCDNSRPLMKALTSHMKQAKVPSLGALSQGLHLLRDMDNRSILSELTQPTLWLLGEKDPLIPFDIRTDLPALQPNARIEVIAGGSHILFFSHPEETSQHLCHFWAALEHNDDHG